MLKLPIDKACTGNDDPARSQVKSKMDRLSKDVLLMICNTPNLARLTDVADHFVRGLRRGSSIRSSDVRRRRRRASTPSSRLPG